MSKLSSATGLKNHHLHKMLALKFAVLVTLFTSSPILEIKHLRSLGNPISWLHLRIGSWIIEHRAIPRFGVFSQLSESPWTDPNWSLQLASGVFYRLMGLRVLPFGVMVFRMLFALLTFILAGGRRGNFWLAVLISTCAQAALLSPSLPTFPYAAVLFAVELFLLFRGRKSGQQNSLYWVPLLIFVWANLDWSFFLGTAVLLLFCGASAVEPFLRKKNWQFGLGDRPAQPPKRIGLIAGATCIASLITPYSYGAYLVGWQNLFGASQLVNSYSMKALNFREPAHYLMMLLTMFAFLVLGRRQCRDIFQVLLVAASANLSFAFGQEAWVVVVASVAVIGDLFFAPDRPPEDSGQVSGKAFWVAAAMAATLIAAATSSLPSSSELLMNVASKKFPVRASDFIRKNHLPGPIYNEMDWGDFLVWYLPEYPVSMDDRYELYGEEKSSRYYAVMSGKIVPSSDPAFVSADTVILSTHSVVIREVELFPNPEEVYRFTFPGFHEVYRDDLAVVLTKQP